MLQLRDYQEKMISDLRVALRKHKRVLLRLPTGGGKTVVATKIAQLCAEKGTVPFWFLCHRDFLLHQTGATFEQADIVVSYMAAQGGRPFNPLVPHQVCSVDTLRNRFERLPVPKLAVWDECHHIGAASWKKLQDRMPDTIHIGLTATPVRLDGKGLREYFDVMVEGPTTAELMARGFLSEFRAYAPSVPDLSQVRTIHGDYNQGDIEKVMSGRRIVGDMVGHYMRLAPNRLIVYFACTIPHSRAIVDAFNAAGVPAMHLDADSSTGERAMAAQRFARRELRVLSNVALFGEGYDLSAQAGMDVTIEAVGLARPTQSLGLFLQQVGRALRPKPYPAIILDHAGNLLEHGLPDFNHAWTLDGKPPKEKSGDGPGGVKVCKSCMAANLTTASVCSVCAAPFTSDPLPVTEVDDILQEIDRSYQKQEEKNEERKARTIDDLIRLARKRGFRNPEGWAAHVFTARARIARENEVKKAAKAAQQGSLDL